MSEFYNKKARLSTGKEIEMSEYKNKVVIIVNVASKCGFTPQYEQLEALYQKYKDKGLVVLGFPCNQFANQEPSSNNEILQFCKLNYGVTFPIFEKIKVNGADTHSLYKYLKSELSGFLGSSIKWNFTKFIIDKEGKPFKRYSPKFKPQKMEEDIINLLNK